MSGAYELIPPVDQDYADHMEFIAVKNDLGLTFRFGVFADTNKAKDKIAEVVINLLAVLLTHGVKAIY